MAAETPSPVIAITSEQELADLLGEPMPRAITKERAELHEVHLRWLARSPFCLVATSGADGRCDVSPKGDPPGFAHVLGPRLLVLPERPGNRRADGFRNILGNPHIGLIFFVPGRADTLRVNGRARLVRDAPYFGAMAVRGRAPLLATEIDVEEVFFHCPKALMRSRLWHPESWKPEGLPSTAELSKWLAAPETPLEELERYYGESYAERLY